MEVICPTCNEAFIYKGGKEHFKRNKNHYCSRKCQNIKHGLSKRNNIDYRYVMFHSAMKRAKEKNIDFHLQATDIPEIPEYCPILNMKILKNDIAGPLDTSPSLDRIDSKKGYIVGNIQIISNRANRIKSDANFNEIEMLYFFMKSKNENTQN
jgi:hypothetical protein